MNQPLDLEHVVTGWLREEASSSGSDRVLAAALTRVSTVGQERRRPTWLHMPMSPRLKSAILAAATVVVVVAVASFGVLNLNRDIQGVSPVVSPQPSATAPSSPAPTPSAAVYPPEGEIPPGVRQSLAVEGVPFSFTVPSEGWSPAFNGKRSDGDLYVAKGTAGGQHAEAVVFWTTFPGGINTSPCHNLMSDPITADLAAVMATAPGTDLVTGPTDVTLGGHDAKHLSLTVREDLGCDPGYFFTWPDECWGSCWIETGVGDTIGVWVVEVDGRRS